MKLFCKANVKNTIPVMEYECALEEFPLFPKLLPELRLCIWQWALQIPRLVLIWKHEKRNTTQIRRSVGSPLLSVNHEARSIALRYYSDPIDPHPSIPYPLTPTSKPYYIGPGSDIVYLSGMDDPTRRYKAVTWTCIFLSQDMDSSHPMFASIRRLAVDEEFLKETPFYQFGKMPHSIWKFLIMDLKDLEEVIVVKRGEGKGLGKELVESMLGEAERGFRGFWEGIWEEWEEGTRKRWVGPKIRVMGLEELVGMCWT